MYNEIMMIKLAKAIVREDANCSHLIGVGKFLEVVLTEEEGLASIRSRPPGWYFVGRLVVHHHEDGLVRRIGYANKIYPRE